MRRNSEAADDDVSHATRPDIINQTIFQIQLEKNVNEVHLVSDQFIN